MSGGQALGRIDFGDFAATEPISRSFGTDRGTPVDRLFVEDFLRDHAVDICGCVLEIGEPVYTDKFGGDRVREATVLEAPGKDNPRADIVADLADGDGVPSEAFDCIILTQTLHMIYDVGGVVATVHRALKPGGVVLATVPGISQIDANDGPEKWFWFMTQTACRRLFETQFAAGGVTVETRGNVYAATAFLQGLAMEELDRAKLGVVDPLYPMLSTIRAVKAR